MERNFPRPYQEVDEQTMRVIKACYARLVERGEHYEGEELRFNERVDERSLQRLVELRLLVQRGPSYRPTVVALLYLPEAERDLEALDAFVRLTHERYRPHAASLNSEEVRSALCLDQRAFNRIGVLAQDLGMDWGQQIGLYEWMGGVPDLEAALLERFGALYQAEKAAEGLPAPAPFDLRPRSLRVRGFRVLRDIELATPGLTALVGPNGVGKSTVLDAFVFLRNAAIDGADVAVRSEAGIDRLKTRGWHGPVELALEFALDYGDGAPAAGEYRLAIDDLRGRVVVERESLTVTRRDGSTATLIDGHRGRCLLADPHGNCNEVLRSAGTLALSRFDRSTPGPVKPAPAPGAHTDEVLAEAGFSADEIAALHAAGVALRA